MCGLNPILVLPRYNEDINTRENRNGHLVVL